MKTRISYPVPRVPGLIVWFVVFIAVFGLACQPETQTKVVEPSAPVAAEAEVLKPSAPAETETKAVEPSTPVEAETTTVGPAATAEIDTNAVEPNAPAEIAAEPDKIGIAVTVNGVDITEAALEVRVAPELKKISERVPPMFAEPYKRQRIQQVLEGMIIEQLLNEQVRTRKIVVTEEEVTEQIEEMASQQELSVEDLKQLVEARGQSFDEVKHRIYRGMGYQKLMEAQFADRINVTEDDAKKYYSENKSKFETSEQVRASHILIKLDTSDPNTDPNEAKADAKAKAHDLLKQVRDGADFAELAKVNSDCPSGARGGDLNFFGRRQMVPPFEKAAFELEVGQVSDIVETQFGYHIIKLTGRKDAGITTFEQARDDIFDMLTQEKQGELAKQYVESLKAEANIVYPAGKEPKSSNITTTPTKQIPAKPEETAPPKDKAAVE